MDTSAKPLMNGYRGFDASEIAKSLMDAVTMLMMLGIWAVDTKSLSTSSPCKDCKPVFSGEYYGLFEVRISGSEDHGLIYSSLWVSYHSRKAVEFYYTESKELIAMTRGNVYKYPPEDIGSLIFFILNPKAEEDATNILKNTNLADDYKTRLHNYLAVKRKTEGISSNIKIDVDLYSAVDCYGLIEVVDVPEAIFKYIEVSYQRFRRVVDWDEIIYRVKLSYGESNIVYTLEEGDKLKALELLIEGVVPRREWGLLAEISKKVMRAISQAYLVMKILR
ncbi:MAG: hypothetical protein QXF10_09325 [Ignisphaera sp.]